MSSSLVNLLPETRHVSAAQRILKPTTQAIPLLDNDLAKYYGLAHTGQLLIYYYFRSSALVANPLTTMIEDLVTLALSQCLFCAICLPSVGNWYSGTDAGEMVKGSAASGRGQKSSSGTSKKKSGKAGRDTGGSWQSRILVGHVPHSCTIHVLTKFEPTSIALILSLMIPTVPLMVLALILGAPLYPTNLLPHTLVLSAHVSLLGTLPIFYTHGVSAAAWKDVSAAWLPFDEAGVWAGTVGAVVGAWFGAIPMALDWDREWQKWPCTVLWAAVLGWGIGRMLTNGLSLAIGRRIDLSVTEYPTSQPSQQQQSTSVTAAIEQKKDE